MPRGKDGRALEIVDLLHPPLASYHLLFTLKTFYFGILKI